MRAKLLLGLLTVGWAAAAPAPTGEGGAAFTFAIPKGQGLLEVSYKNQKVLVYAFATSQFKPYVRELRTLDGDNVLRDAPQDHLHHHGLMYAIRVNGNNFWEERDQPGYEKPVELSTVQTGTSSSGLPQASFTQVIHWVANKDAGVAKTSAVALLVERRTLTLTVDQKTQEIALDWHADFEVGQGAQAVTLSGANYHGLGLRLPEPFNRVARHENSENAPYPTHGTGDVTPARWSSVSHRLNGRDITLALFGRPTPEGKLPLFFTMVQPFTYLSATQGLDKSPLRYSADDRFSVDYRLVVYSTHRAPAFLQERYDEWARR
jgi:hypothetical protein